MNLEGKAVLMTGGSSGIGLAMAQALGAKGARLLLAARRKGPLDAAVAGLREAGFEAHAVAADVVSSEGRATIWSDQRLSACDQHCLSGSSQSTAAPDSPTT